METRLRELMQAVVGDPPHRVTATAVRRQVVRRRTREAAGILATVFVAVVGVTAAVRVFGAAPGPAVHQRPPASTVYLLYAHGFVRPGLTPGGLLPISTATNTPGRPIHVGFPGAAVLTPDGKTVYVATGYTVTPISTATNTPGKPIHVQGTPPFGVAINPDGKTVYVSGSFSGTLTPVSTVTNTAGKPIHVASSGAIAFTPDGKTAYVVNSQESPGTVTPISTAANRPGKPIHVGPLRPDAIAIAPDGKTVYVLG